MYIVLVGLCFIFNKQKHEMMAVVFLLCAIVTRSIVFCSSKYLFITTIQHCLFEY